MITITAVEPELNYFPPISVSEVLFHSIQKCRANRTFVFMLKIHNLLFGTYVTKFI